MNQVLDLAYWNATVLDEIPLDDSATIVVMYTDGEAAITNWGDEKTEQRVDKIMYWVGIPIVDTVRDHDDNN